MKIVLSRKTGIMSTCQPEISMKKIVWLKQINNQMKKMCPCMPPPADINNGPPLIPEHV